MAIAINDESNPIAKPNIVFILTDDLDVSMGGMNPLKKTRRLLAEPGATFTNAFASTPICCPSRSTILSGRYQHNTKVLNNTIAGNCSSSSWQAAVEPSLIGKKLQLLGYKTFYSGKYLNMYGSVNSGGVSHVPPGWDSWNGLVGNSRYFNYSISRNGKEEKHGDNFTLDYLTDLVANDSISFIEDMASKNDPFFMIVAPPAPHEPWTAKPEYQNMYANESAPRDNHQWNVHREDAHWVVRNAPNPMSKASTQWADNAFRSRWRCLMSVDDLVEGIVTTLTEKNLLDNTYIIFTSDHGYHTGQFSLPYDKRQPYDFDLRIPLLVRGPKIKANTTIPYSVSTVDLAPTIMAMADEKAYEIEASEDSFDGISFKKLLDGGIQKDWRQNILIEYHGEGIDDPDVEYGCPGLGPGVSECKPDCVCDDATNNTYACVRRQTFGGEPLNITADLLYCEFVDSDNFIEIYDLMKDPSQLKNLRSSLDPTTLENLNMELIELSSCLGKSCWSIDYDFGPHTDSKSKKLEFLPQLEEREFTLI